MLYHTRCVAVVQTFTRLARPRSERYAIGLTEVASAVLHGSWKCKSLEL